MGAGPHAGQQDRQVRQGEQALQARELAAHQGARRIRRDGEEADHRARADQRALRPHDGGDRRRQCRVGEGARASSEDGPARGEEARRRRAATRAPASCRRRNSSPPQLATLVEAPPDGKEWLHEIKFDGYRVQAAVGGGKATIYTRTGLDWTDKFRSIVRPLADLPVTSALIDGEAVVQDEDGKSDFGALQDAIAEGQGKHRLLRLRPAVARRRGSPQAAADERKAKLAKLLEDQPAAGPLFYSDHVVGDGQRHVRAGLRDEARRHRLQARRRALPLGAHEGLAEGRNAAWARSSSSSAGSPRR